MRWLPYLILGYVALGLQIGLRDLLSFHGGAPNFVLLAVVYMGLNLPRNSALLGSFFLGLVQDCCCQHPAGLYALSYGLTALIVVGTQQVVYRQHPLAHFGLTLLGGLVVALVLTLHAYLHPASPAQVAENGAPLPALRDSPIPPLISAVYSALLAPGLLWILNRFRPLAARGGRRAWA
jgi:rod shape-determining protein MreD